MSENEPITTLAVVISNLRGFFSASDLPLSSLTGIEFPIPKPLRLVYANFDSLWRQGERTIFGYHDKLQSCRGLKLTSHTFQNVEVTPNRLCFCGENQWSWFALTYLEELDDAPVEVHNDSECFHIASLADFLTSHMLKEVLMANQQQVENIELAALRGLGFTHIAAPMLHPYDVGWRHYYFSPDQTVVLASYDGERSAGVASKAALGVNWLEHI
jgi:hypothetical protein